MPDSVIDNVLGIKNAVSLPDVLFKEAETLTRRLKIRKQFNIYLFASG
jgi:hypothetical protein